jgi:molybdopterin-guanine dinucleotide biosynthesis protein A
MLGIILCGGRSQRMGSDKGLIERDGRIWAEIAEGKLKDLNVSTAFSVNREQQAIYSHHLGQENLIVDDPLLDVHGPLLGVLSAHLRNPEEDLLLLACDLILMESRLLENIFIAFQTDESFDAYIYTKDGAREPLCGIYKPAGMKMIMNLVQRSELKKHSMKYVLSILEVCEIPLAHSDYGCFTNFNSHSEINGL